MNTELNLYFYFIKQYFQIFSIWKLRFMNLLDSEKKHFKVQNRVQILGMGSKFSPNVVAIFVSEIFNRF